MTSAFLELVIPLWLVCIDTELRISDACLNNKICMYDIHPCCLSYSSGSITVGANSTFLATLHSSTCLQSTHFLGVVECASKNVKFCSRGQVNVYKLRSALHMVESRSTSMQWSRCEW
jgi:hypothetical protein